MPWSVRGHEPASSTRLVGEGGGSGDRTPSVRWEGRMSKVTEAGIDVSKDVLDVAVRRGGNAWRRPASTTPRGPRRGGPPWVHHHAVRPLHPPAPLTDKVAMYPAPVRPGAHAVRVRSGEATKRRQYPPEQQARPCPRARAERRPPRGRAVSAAAPRGRRRSGRSGRRPRGPVPPAGHARRCRSASRRRRERVPSHRRRAASTHRGGRRRPRRGSPTLPSSPNEIRQCGHWR